MEKRFCLLLFFRSLFTAPALWAQQKAIPKSDEGTSSFLPRHNRTLKKYYDDFTELNKTRLGKNRTPKMGVTYLIPPVKKASDTTLEKGSETGSAYRSKHTEVNEPLFKRWLANVKVTSDRPAGTRFCAISGYGGPDLGAIGRIGEHELHEGGYTYDIALRLARNLMQEGTRIRIIIQDAQNGTRDETYSSSGKRGTCVGSPIPLDQVQRLQQRCDKTNTLYQRDRKKFKYCRAIFIYIGSRSKGTQTDVLFYHSSRRAESKRLTRNTKATFESKYSKYQPNRGFSGIVSGHNLYVLAHTMPASVFVGLGSIQNTLDQRRLMIPFNR